jgi:hypothetical protein
MVVVVFAVLAVLVGDAVVVEATAIVDDVDAVDDELLPPHAATTASTSAGTT